MSEEIEEIPNVIISKIYLEYIIYIYTIQEAYQLKDFLITTANINKYDYDTMIKDLEATTRHEDHLKKIRRKWLEESKKYKEAVEHMKEYQEETYKKKNSELVNKLKKKDQVLLTVLKKNQQSKMKERQKAIESMMEKEKKSRENVQNFLKQQEKERQKLQIDTDVKSNYIYFFNIIFIYNLLIQ